LTDTIEGIDDPASRHYNRLVDTRSIAAKDWRSSERMRRAGDVYRWGVVVGHNWKQVPAAGSCIFLHVWDGAGVGTSGCTAMPEAQMLKVIRWLDRKKNPTLVQLPAAHYRRLRNAWNLP
jgi:D-alanyl-D-alanine dipeptidase